MICPHCQQDTERFDPGSPLQRMFMAIETWTESEAKRLGLQGVEAGEKKPNTTTTPAVGPGFVEL
jgi:hypothetical protein